jgi:hypothetical protein
VLTIKLSVKTVCENTGRGYFDLDFLFLYPVFFPFIYTVVLKKFSWDYNIEKIVSFVILHVW